MTIYVTKRWEYCECKQIETNIIILRDVQIHTSPHVVVNTTRILSEMLRSNYIHNVGYVSYDFYTFINSLNINPFVLPIIKYRIKIEDTAPTRQSVCWTNDDNKYLILENCNKI